MKRSNVVISMPYIESKFNGMKDFAWPSILALKGRQFQQFCHTQIKSKRRTIKCEMDCLQVIREATHLLFICWIPFSTIVCEVFSGIESKKSRIDFRCNVTGDIDKDSIPDKFYHQCVQIDKLGTPPDFFILVNVSLIQIVPLLCFYCAKSAVNRLERSHQDAIVESTNQRRSRRFFIPYLFELVVSITFRLIFNVSLEKHVLYPTNFHCFIENSLSVNRTQCTNFFTCFHDQAAYKNFWKRTATVANGLLVIFESLVILWTLWQACSDDLRQAQPEAIPLVEPQHGDVNIAREPGNAEITPCEHTEHAPAQKDFQSAIQTLKENCLWYTEQLSDLKQPFGRPKPGEGYIHDLKMDEIYVNVAIHEGRAHHYVAEDLGRWEQLKEYPPDAEDCYFAKPEDIIDKEHRNVLVVGLPGIGKTSLSTNMLRLWASGEAFNRAHYEESAHFDVVFLMKFRRFNDNAELSLRELLARAETLQSLDDPVWDFINKESTKVLLIFDGVNEYSRKEDINAQQDDPTYNENDVEEKMPISVLYNKLAKGKLLCGASILTTTRPTAIQYIEHVGFQRRVEIRGFTPKNVEDYVEKFTRRVPGSKEKIWGHIKSNVNLFSLSYIPVNCFLICHCLLQMIHFKYFQATSTKMTDICKMTVRMFFLNHNRERFSLEELEGLKSTHLYKQFEEFPDELQKIFNKLGEIAYTGIKQGRLFFESTEVTGLEDCGLIHELPHVESERSGNDAPNSQFCFTHRTVREFFAAKHLVDNKRDKRIEKFVCKHIDDGTWQVVLQFVAGMLRSSSSNIFIKLLPKKTNEKTDRLSSELEKLIFWPAEKKHKDLAVKVCKCLFEINDEQQPVLQNKIEKINFNTVNFSGCSLAPIDLAAVLHFLEKAGNVLNINLSSNELGDLSANDVKKTIVNGKCKIKWLKLTNNKFTDEVAEVFAAALTHDNCELERLDLSDNQFTEEGRQYLTNAGKQSRCKVII